MRLHHALKREWPLVVNVAAAALFLVFGTEWVADLSNPFRFAAILASLFAVILPSAFAVMRHAEAIAMRTGEPLGTLILTLAVTGIEVMMITAVMYAGHGNEAMARDSMFAVIMIVLGGVVGLALLAGGLRHHEQTYNLQGANVFLAVIVPLAVLSLILPTFTVSSPGPTLTRFQGIFLSVMSIGLFGVFLAIQNLRHRDYFVAPVRPVVVMDRTPPPTPSMTLAKSPTICRCFSLICCRWSFCRRRLPFQLTTASTSCAPSGARRVSRGGSHPLARVARRGAGGPSESIAALGQHFAWLGPGDNQPHRPGRLNDRPRYGPNDRARARSGRYRAARLDVGRQHVDVCQRADQRLARGGPSVVVLCLRHADLRLKVVNPLV